MTGSFLPERPHRADAATLGAIYVVVLCVIPANLVFAGLPLSITPASILALGMALCWMCAHFTNTLGMAKGRNPVRTGLYLVVVSLLASYAYANFHYLPADEIRSADQSLVLITSLIGAALLVCDGVRRTDRLDTLLRAIVIACAFVAVVGVLQFLADIDLTKSLTLPGLRSTVDYGFIDERAGFRRPAGTTGTPIEFGVLCAMALPLAVHYGLVSNARRRGQALWWGCSALLAAGILYSVSRSAILGVVGVFVILFIGWPARRRIWAAIAGVVFLVFIKLTADDLLGTIYGLFSNFSSDPSVQYRTHDYPVIAAKIAMSPLLGSGVGTHYAPKHIVLDNQYLLTVVESGFIGLAVLVALFAIAMVSALHARYRAKDTEVRDLLLALMAALSVPIVGALTFDLLSFKTVTGVMFLLIGAIGCLHRIVSAPDEQPTRPREATLT